MPADGNFAFGVILPTGAGTRRESAVDATHRRAIHTDAVLRDSEDDLVAERAGIHGELEAGPPADATDGSGGDLPKTAAIGSGTGLSHLSVPFARAEDRSTEPGLVERHNLYPPAARVYLSGGGAGLVQPLCPGLGSLSSLETSFCLAALDWALQTGQPDIFNTDQGCQFTSDEFTGRLETKGIGISMDGRGRVTDNIFIERLWRTVKYEEVYLKDYLNVLEAVSNLKSYFAFYNQERPHQALGHQTPAAIYFGHGQAARGAAGGWYRSAEPAV